MHTRCRKFKGGRRFFRTVFLEKRRALHARAARLSF